MDDTLSFYANKRCVDPGGNGRQRAERRNLTWIFWGPHMAADRSQLGRRYTCFSCGCKFYDLNRPEAICPRCGKDQIDDPSPDPRVAAMAASKKAKAAAAANPAPAEPSEPDLDTDVAEDDDLNIDLDDDEPIGDVDDEEA